MTRRLLPAAGAGLILVFLFVAPAAATVTIDAVGTGSYYIGDDIVFSGLNDEGTTIYLFLTGPNLPANGAQIASIDPPNNPVQDSNPLTFKAALVDSGTNAWTWTWTTGGTTIADAGTYTVYALTAPHDKDNLAMATYSTAPIILKKPFSSPSTRTWIVDPNATLFIGEEGLDITDVMEGEDTIAWWASPADVYTTPPTKTIDVTIRKTSFYVAPSDFTSFTGRWYSFNTTDWAVNSPAFTVADPSLDVAIVHVTDDVSDQTVPQYWWLRFKITTNMHTVGEGTPRLNKGTDGDTNIDIILKDPNGIRYWSVYDDYGVPVPLTGIFVDSQPFEQGIWDTGSQVNENRRYPAGTYTVMAVSTLNRMRDNYQNAGADYTGKTVSPLHTITLSPLPEEARAAVESVVADPAILNNDDSMVTVSAYPEKLAGSTVVSPWGDSKPQFVMPYDGYFVFIDDAPNANWEHPARWVAVSEDGSGKTVFDAWSPPLDLSLEYARGKAPNPAGGTVADPAGNCASFDCSHCYALLISGGMNPQNNNIRYWTDISSMYTMLRSGYCYPANHITVLMSDGASPGLDRLKGYSGTTPQYDNSPTDFGLGDRFSNVNGSATRTNVINNLTSLNKTLTSDDTLFIFVTNHGGNDSTPRSGNSKLYLWNNESVTDKEFVSTIKTMKAKAVSLTMSQCFGGGFIDDFTSAANKPATQTRIITTVANKDEPSWGSAFNIPYIGGSYGPGDGSLENGGVGDRDGVVSMQESFAYGKLNDEYARYGYEHPQITAAGPLTSTAVNLSTCWKVISCPEVRGVNGKPVPNDMNSDCLFEDVNGDKRADSADPVFFFANFEWIMVNEPYPLVFDFNRNNRIDFGDVVQLYLISR